MRKITQESIEAFEQGRPFKKSNTCVYIGAVTNKRMLKLFGNTIAVIDEDGLRISNCDWKTNTTKERLNGLSGVSIVQRAGQWYLNGKAWDGEMVNINKWDWGTNRVLEDTFPAHRQTFLTETYLNRIFQN